MDAPRRPMGYWDTFNQFWRDFVDKNDRRPSVHEMRSWYDENAFAIWGAHGPSWEETKKHSKGMRRLQDIPTYFRNYRRGRKKRAGGAAGDDYVTDSDSETQDGELAPTPRKKKQPRARANSAQHPQATAADDDLPQPKQRPRAASTSQVTISAAALKAAAAGNPAMTLFGLAIPFLGAWGRARSSSTPAIPAAQIAQLEQAGAQFWQAQTQAGDLGQATEESSTPPQEPPYVPEGTADVCAGPQSTPLPAPFPAPAPTVLEQFAPLSAEEPGSMRAPSPPAQDLRHPHDQQQRAYAARPDLYEQGQSAGYEQKPLTGFEPGPAQAQTRDYEEQMGPFSTIRQQQLLLQQDELLPRPKAEPADGIRGAVGPIGARAPRAVAPAHGPAGGQANWRHAAPANGATGGGRGDAFAAAGGLAGGHGGGGGAGGIVTLDSTMLMQVPSSALPPDMRVNEQRGMLNRLFPRNSTLKMVHSLFNRWSAQQDAAEADAAAAGRAGAAAGAANAAYGSSGPNAGAHDSNGFWPPPTGTAALHQPYGPTVVTTGGVPQQPFYDDGPQQQHYPQQPHLHQEQQQQWPQQEAPAGQWQHASSGVLPSQPQAPCGLVSGGVSGGSGTSNGAVDAVGYITMPTPQPLCVQQAYLHPPSACNAGYGTPAGAAMLGKRGRGDDSPLSAKTGFAVGRTFSNRKLQRGLSGVLGPLVSWMSLGRRNSTTATQLPPADTGAGTPAPGNGMAASAQAVAGMGGPSIGGTSSVGLGLALGFALDLPAGGDGGVGGLLSGLGDSTLLDGLPSLADAAADGVLADMMAERAAAGGSGGGAGGCGGGGVYRSGGDGGEREAAAAAEAAGAVAVMAATAGGEGSRCAEMSWPTPGAVQREEQAGLSCVTADANLPTPFVVPEMQQRVSASSYGQGLPDVFTTERAREAAAACGAPHHLTAEMRTRPYPAGAGAEFAREEQEGRQEFQGQRELQMQGMQMQAQLPSRTNSEMLGGSLLRRLSTSLSDYFRFLAR